MNDTRDRNFQESETQNEQNDSGSAHTERPFDTSGIDWTPRREKNDPPYRDWWVIERDNE
jgi:hypothetical protein